MKAKLKQDIKSLKTGEIYGYAETIYNSMYPVIPITSVRRALTMGSLTEYKGKKLIPIFRKLATKDNGKYQYPNRQWEAIIKS